METVVLTQLEKRILTHIREYIGTHAISPTIAEVADALNIRSRGTVHRYVHSLIDKGQLVRLGTGWRGLRVVGDALNPVAGGSNTSAHTGADTVSDTRSTKEPSTGSDFPTNGSTQDQDQDERDSSAAQATSPVDENLGRSLSRSGSGYVDLGGQHSPGAANALKNSLPSKLGRLVPGQSGGQHPPSHSNAIGSGKRTGLSSRSGALTAPLLTIPLLGKIAAGMPIEAIPDEDHLDLAAFFIGPDRYALRVSGESMIDAGILDGDTVIIRKQSTARPGDIVVALIDAQEATLKRLGEHTAQVVELIAENQIIPKMRYSASRVAIQGILIGQLRSY